MRGDRGIAGRRGPAAAGLAVALALLAGGAARPTLAQPSPAPPDQQAQPQHPAPGQVVPPPGQPAPPVRPGDEGSVSPSHSHPEILPTHPPIRLRMGYLNAFFLYKGVGKGAAGGAPHAVIFFSGDWGWRPLQQQTAQHLAFEGRTVLGVDSSSYFGRKLEPTDWAMDLKTLRTFINEKAGLPPETPVLLIGFTWGAELVPFMLNRGGAEGIAGALLIGPDQSSTCIFRVTIQMKGVPQPPDEVFDVTQEISRLKPLPVVLMQGADDAQGTVKAFEGILKGRHKTVMIPGADRQFRETRDTYLEFVSQSLAWLEGPGA